MTPTPKRIGVAFSGGLDSAVTVRLLQNDGYDVEAWHMLTCTDTPTPNTITLAQALNVPLHIIDLRQAFQDEVITPFYDAYAQGLTPNPCVWCNPRLKFGHLRRAINGWMATGHYVQKITHPTTGTPTLKRATDLTKDQTYFLAALTPDDLRHTLFPLAHYTRTQVIDLARQWHLPIPQEKLTSGSQDICFLPDGDYRPELCRRHPQCATPGNILNTDGKIIGQHTGLANYTRGQRKGLNISTGSRAYVIAFDRTHNTLTLGPKEALRLTTFHLTHLNWLIPPPTYPHHCHAVTRYHHPPFPCTITADGTITTDTPQTHITPGQLCALYHNDLLLGSGTIR